MQYAQGKHTSLLAVLVCPGDGPGSGAGGGGGTVLKVTGSEAREYIKYTNVHDF